MGGGFFSKGSSVFGLLGVQFVFGRSPKNAHSPPSPTTPKP